MTRNGIVTTSLQRRIYTLDMLRDDARERVYNLADNEFLQRDRIIDLLSQERWDEDT